MQQPRSLTRFRCWSLAISFTSFLNSSIPCFESLESLFTAISCPFESLPYKFIEKVFVNCIVLWSSFSICKFLLVHINFTQKTAPKPPSPSLLEFEKSSVECDIVDKSNNGSSMSSSGSSSSLPVANFIEISHPRNLLNQSNIEVGLAYQQRKFRWIYMVLWPLSYWLEYNILKWELRSSKLESKSWSQK